MNIPTQHIYRHLMQLDQLLNVLIGLVITLIWVWAAWRMSRQPADELNQFIHHIEEEGAEHEQYHE